MLISITVFYRSLTSRFFPINIKFDFATCSVLLTFIFFLQTVIIIAKKKLESGIFLYFIIIINLHYFKNNYHHCQRRMNLVFIFYLNSYLSIKKLFQILSLPFCWTSSFFCKDQNSHFQKVSFIQKPSLINHHNRQF